MRKLEPLSGRLTEQEYCFIIIMFKPKVPKLNDYMQMISLDYRKPNSSYSMVFKT